MRFTQWLERAEFEAQTPDQPGVWQRKTLLLLQYPTGRSGMLEYGHGKSLKSCTENIKDVPNTLYRYVVCDSEQAARWLCEELSGHFKKRFGALPGAL